MTRKRGIRVNCIIAALVIFCAVAGCNNSSGGEDFTDTTPKNTETEKSTETDGEPLQDKPDQVIITVNAASLCEDFGKLQESDAFPAVEYSLLAKGLSVPVTFEMEQCSVPRSISAYGQMVKLADGISLYGNCVVTLFEYNVAVIFVWEYYDVGYTYVLSEYGVDMLSPDEIASTNLNPGGGQLVYNRVNIHIAQMTQEGGLSCATSYDEFLLSTGLADIVDGKIKIYDENMSLTVSDRYDLDREFTDLYSVKYANIDEVFAYNKRRFEGIHREKYAVAPSDDIVSDGYILNFNNTFANEWPGQEYAVMNLPRINNGKPNAEAWNAEIADKYFSIYDENLKLREKGDDGGFTFNVTYKVYTERNIVTVSIFEFSGYAGTGAVGAKYDIYHYYLSEDRFISDDEYIVMLSGGKWTLESAIATVNAVHINVDEINNYVPLTADDVQGVIPSSLDTGGFDLCYQGYYIEARFASRVYINDYKVSIAPDGSEHTYYLCNNDNNEGYYLMYRNLSDNNGRLLYPSSYAADSEELIAGRIKAELVNHAGVWYVDVFADTIGNGTFDGEICCADNNNISAGQFYREYLDGKCTVDDLYHSEAVRSNMASNVNEILACYRNGKNPLDILPLPDPESMAEYPSGLAVRDDVTANEICAMSLASDGYMNKFVVPLNYTYYMDLHWDVGQFGESTQLYITKIVIYDYMNRIQSYRPNGASELLFCHKIFTSRAYVCSYRTNPASICVYYTTDYGDSFQKIDLPVPAEFVSDTAEAVYAGGMGGSGECQIIIKLKTADGRHYLRYDNGKGLNEGGFGFTQFGYTGVLNADEIIMMSGDGSFTYPNINVPRSADSSDELSNLGLDETDVRLQYIRAFVTGDIDTLEQICGVETGMYNCYKTLVLSYWLAWIDTDDNGNDHVRFAVKPEKSEIEAFYEGAWNDCYAVGESSMYGAYIYDVYWSTPIGTAANELYDLLSNHIIRDLPTTDEMDYTTRFELTCYICNKLGDAASRTEENIRVYAKKCFGIDNFTPDVPHIEYGCAHGGSTQMFSIVGNKIENGETTFTVQFFADLSKTVKSHTYKYTMKSSDSYWIFTDCDEIYHSEYEPCGWSM